MFHFFRFDFLYSWLLHTLNNEFLILEKILIHFDDSPKISDRKRLILTLNCTICIGVVFMFFANMSQQYDFLSLQ